MKPYTRTTAVFLGGLLLCALPGVTGAASAQTNLNRYKHTRIHTQSYHVDPPQGQCCAYYGHTYEVCSQQITVIPGPNNCTEEYVTSSSGQTDPPSVTVNGSP